MFSFFRRATNKTKDDDSKKDKSSSAKAINSGAKTAGTTIDEDSKKSTMVKSQQPIATTAAAKSIIVPLKGNSNNRMDDAKNSNEKLNKSTSYTRYPPPLPTTSGSVSSLPMPSSDITMVNSGRRRQEDCCRKVLNSEVNNVAVNSSSSKARCYMENNLNVSQIEDDKTALKNLKLNFNVKTFEDKLPPLTRTTTTSGEAKNLNSLPNDTIINCRILSNNNNNNNNNPIPINEKIESPPTTKRNDSLIYIDDEKEPSVDRVMIDGSTFINSIEKSSKADMEVTPEKIRNLLNLLENANNSANSKFVVDHDRVVVNFNSSQEDNFGTAPSSPTAAACDNEQFDKDNYSSKTNDENVLDAEEFRGNNFNRNTDRTLLSEIVNPDGKSPVEHPMFDDECTRGRQTPSDRQSSSNEKNDDEAVITISEEKVTVPDVNNYDSNGRLTLEELQQQQQDEGVCPVELEYSIEETSSSNCNKNVSPFNDYYYYSAEQQVCSSQIPYIQITECSDSEGENEVVFLEDDSSSRVYPSILSDIEEDEEPYSDASDVEPADNVVPSEIESSISCRRNVVHQETKFQDQIKRLTCDIEVKEVENSVLKQKIVELEKDIETNRKTIEHYVNENKSQKLEELRSTIDHLRFRVKDLESELREKRAESEKLQSRYADLKTEKEVEIKLIRQTLEDVEFQKKSLENKFDNEYEKLRTVNTDREQHLLDDFEWKLREVEQSCKRKLEEKEINATEKLNRIQTQLTSEIEKLKNEIDKLRTYEAELVELKNTSIEQQRSLKAANKTVEQLQLTESQLNDEVSKLRCSLEKERNYLATVQGIHSREIAEKDRKHQFRLEQQRNELIAEWEDKIRRELTRLRLELERNYKEEKRSLTEELKQKHEKELKDSNQMWEKKLLDTRKEIDRLNKKFSSKEEYYKEELLKMQTNSDRDMLELRRKIDKLDMSYQERLEKKEEQYEKDMESLRTDYEQRLHDCEEHWSRQVNTTSASLETVKQESQREFKQRTEELENNHRTELEKQYNELILQKETEISQLQSVHSEQMRQFQQQYEDELKSMRLKETELLQMNEMISKDISGNANYVQELETSLRNTNNNYSTLLEQKTNDFKRELELALKKTESDHNKLTSELKEHYESEIKHLQTKVNELNQPCSQLQKSRELETDLKQQHENGIIPTAPTRSSRRKGRGRHKANKQYQNGPTSAAHLNKQFSSSSL